MTKKENMKAHLDEIILKIIMKEKPETVEQLINIIKEKQGIPKESIMNHIIKLRDENKIKIREAQIHYFTSMKEHLFSFNAAWYWIILIITIATMISTLTP